MCLFLLSLSGCCCNPVGPGNWEDFDAIFYGSDIDDTQYDPSQMVRLLGKVTDAHTGTPIVAAQLTIVSLNRISHSDSEGSYRFFLNIEAGKYWVVACKDGFVTDSAEVNIPADNYATLDFRLRKVGN